MDRIGLVVVGFCMGMALAALLALFIVHLPRRAQMELGSKQQDKAGTEIFTVDFGYVSISPSEDPRYEFTAEELGREIVESRGRIAHLEALVRIANGRADRAEKSAEIQERLKREYRDELDRLVSNRGRKAIA